MPRKKKERISVERHDRTMLLCARHNYELAINAIKKAGEFERESSYVRPFFNSESNSIKERVQEISSILKHGWAK